MATFKERISIFKNRLLKISDQEPLSLLSLVVIIALDIFILVVLFQGLHEHSRQLTSPYEYVTHECRQALIDQNWTEATRLDKLQEVALCDHGDYSYRYDSFFDEERMHRMHPICLEFHRKLKVVSDNRELVNLFKERKKRQSEKNDLTEKFKQTKDVYDTSLLENIAGVQTKVGSIETSMKETTQHIEKCNKILNTVEERINSTDSIRVLWTFISGNENKERLLTDLKPFEFWFPLKKLAWQFVFLLPLFIVFFLWHTKSAKKDNKLQILISSHLLVISAIPIFIKVLDIVLSLIPHHFLDHVFDVLVKLNIIAFWHYGLILAAIFFALFVIYIIQKKIFSKRRLELRRLMKGQCIHCGKKLPTASRTCPFCGAPQLETCPGCHQDMYIAGEYCNFCGTPK